MARKGSQKSSQIDPGGRPIRTEKGFKKWTPTRSQNDPKMVPKWTSKRIQKWTKIGPGPQEAPRRVPGGPERDARSGSEAQEKPSNPQERPNASLDANTIKSVILTTISRKFMFFFVVAWAFQHGRKLPPKRAKKEKITRGAKREQIEAKVRSKTRPDAQKRHQQAPKWPATF